MTTTLFYLHSGVRWLVVAFALAALLWFGLVWARRASNARLDRMLMLLFTISIDIQVLLGILHLLERAGVEGGIARPQIEHSVIMIVALGLAHFTARWRKAEAPIRARNNFLAIIGVLALVFIGVTLLPGNLMRWGIGVL